MDVALLHWPADSARAETLREAGTAFVLLVPPETAAPDVAHCREDWIRLPASDDDIRARAALVKARADAHGICPSVDDSGVLRFRDQWAALSPVELRLAAPLVERFGAVVGRDALSRRAWPGGVPSRNALDVHILRLRRRITPLGLELRTVRARGYLMQTAGA